MPEGEEKDQGNLFEKVKKSFWKNKEIFLNLVKEIDMQVQEAQRVLNEMDAKRPTPRHIIIKMPRVKDKESYKQQEKSSYLLRSSHKTVSWFLKRCFAGKKGLSRSTQSDEKEGPTSKITLPSKAII